MNKLTTYIALGLATVMASCSNDQLDGNATLNGISKTPIAVQTNLSATPISRAFDKTFEKDDQLFAYIEAGKKVDGDFVYEGQFRWADNFILTRDVTTTTEEGIGNITSTTEDGDLDKTLYWDDFSSTDYDLRSDNPERGIRLKYGYCYNGGEEANATNKDVEAGTLTWTVATDQSTAIAMKQSDLLYAATQEMIKYGHDQESRGTLVLPYTHAMSKITIIVNTGEGFKDTDANFASSVLTLKNMQVKTDVDAPAATVTPVSTAGTAPITTYIQKKENTTATYQAIVGPTNLSLGNVLASITNVGGASEENSFNIPITSGILDAWSGKLAVSEEVIYNGTAQAKPVFSKADIGAGVGYITKPGVHYILTVTVDKQAITIRATITDWEAVDAEGRAAINFNSDVTEKGTIAEELQAKGFDVYKSNSNTSFPATASTTATYADSKWSYSPTIYWAGQADASYFRAISPKGNPANSVEQGTDLMWGTSGNTAITPRTGDVPLEFQHLMSKLCVNLETTDDAAAVNLTGAKIQITNLATSGTLNIVDATVSAGSPAGIMLSDKASGFTEYVIPQTIGNDARVVITLADGTTYSLQLNKCVLTGTDTAVNAWENGKSYTYTIHLEKEAITFRALVKEWDEKTGSGNATLEWD